MAKLSIICNVLGNPGASDLSANDMSTYREACLKVDVRNEDGEFMSPVKFRQVNIKQRNLSSVLSTLKMLGRWSALSPLAGPSTFKIAEGK